MLKYSARNSLFRFYIKCTDAEEIMLISCLFSILLVSFRIIYTGRLMFSSLVWNLLLAFIPYFISKRLMKLLYNKRRWVFLIGVFVWLLFIPNSFYIITDLFHLDMNVGMPLWFDLALLLSFAWNGLLLGIVSVRHMEKLFESFYNNRFDLLFIFPVMLLNALGVYIGRYLRFNSWDIIANPFQLIQDIIYLFIHPVRYRFDWGMIFCYSMLMTLFYVTLKRLNKLL